MANSPENLNTNKEKDSFQTFSEDFARFSKQISEQHPEMAQPLLDTLHEMNSQLARISTIEEKGEAYFELQKLKRALKALG